jgi:hypothetical protein
MNEVDVYCRKNTILYIYSNYIKVTYFGNEITESIKDKEDIFETLNRLFNNNKNISNLENIVNDIIIMTQDFEQKLRKKLVFNDFSVNVISI